MPSAERRTAQAAAAPDEDLPSPAPPQDHWPSGKSDLQQTTVMKQQASEKTRQLWSRRHGQCYPRTQRLVSSTERLDELTIRRMTPSNSAAESPHRQGLPDVVSGTRGNPGRPSSSPAWPEASLPAQEPRATSGTRAGGRRFSHLGRRARRMATLAGCTTSPAGGRHFSRACLADGSSRSASVVALEPSV